MKSRIAIVAAGMVLALVVLTGCASGNAIPTSWLRSTAGGVAYLTWTDAKSGITGTLQNAILPSKRNNGKLTQARYTFVGTISKGEIVLHLVDGKAKETDRGTISATKLVFDSTVLRPGTGQQYVDALTKLKAASAAR